MSIRENISRVLFFGLLLTMLIVPVGYAVTNIQLASHNDAKFTLFQSEDTDDAPAAVIASDCNGGGSNGGCGG